MSFLKKVRKNYSFADKPREDGDFNEMEDDDNDMEDDDDDDGSENEIDKIQATTILDWVENGTHDQSSYESLKGLIDFPLPKKFRSIRGVLYRSHAFTEKQKSEFLKNRKITIPIGSWTKNKSLISEWDNGRVLLQYSPKEKDVVVDINSAVSYIEEIYPDLFSSYSFYNEDEVVLKDVVITKDNLKIR